MKIFLKCKFAMIIISKVNLILNKVLCTYIFLFQLLTKCAKQHDLQFDQCEKLKFIFYFRRYLQNSSKEYYPKHNFQIKYKSYVAFKMILLMKNQNFMENIHKILAKIKIFNKYE